MASKMTISQPGMYALIKTLEDPLPLPDLYTEIVVPSTKLLSATQQKKRKQDGRKAQTTNLFLVPVDTIYEPISAIPNLGGEPGDFLFVRPVDGWADAFTNYIDMYHEENEDQ